MVVRRPVLVLVTTAILAAGAAGCSNDDAGPTTSVGDGADGTTEDALGDATSGPTSDLSAPSTGPSTPVDPTALVTAPTTVLETLPEVGIPGLDSDELFCRSWSRFAGSFQVVAVAAAFGSGATTDVAELEVAASTVVVDAFDELLAAWPDELADEADVVAESFLGPYARRWTRARAALVDAGAGPADVDAIAEAWLAALADRDPAAVEPDVTLDDARRELIRAAGVAFDAAVTPFALDPSLATDAEVPATEAYLAATCPDRGTLAGSEIGG